MLKIILDTNVLVSALIQRSYPHFVVQEIFNNPNIKVCLSHDLFVEYYEVLSRSKFNRFTDFHTNAQSLLLDIIEYSQSYTPKAKVDMLKDKQDNRLLELAAASNANFLITGNHQDFTIDNFKSTKIVNPREFYENVIQKLRK